MVSRGRRGRRALLVLVPLVGFIVAGPAQPAGAATIGAQAEAAVGYGNRHGMASDIAVFDTRTGRLFTAGRPARLHVSASVVKTLIATRLLLTDRMSPVNRALAWKMITQSDNAAADTLYARVGRDRLLPALAAHYDLPGLGTPPTEPGLWGTTQITARGLARFYGAVRQDPRVWPWLGRAMHHYASYSSAGEPNAWGVAAAAPGAAIKNGWLLYRSRAVINSTGVVNHDRYAVAILSEGASGRYYSAGEAVVSRQATLLIPEGRLVPPPTLTSLSIASGPVDGGTRVVVHGIDFVDVRTVSFGTLRAGGVEVLSPTRLVAFSPRHDAGLVRVRVHTAHGVSLPVQESRFRYVAN